VEGGGEDSRAKGPGIKKDGGYYKKIANLKEMWISLSIMGDYRPCRGQIAQLGRYTGLTAKWEDEMKKWKGIIRLSFVLEGFGN